MKSGSHLSIWFFTGICLGVNGLLIFITGMYEIANPPANKVALYDLHANVWWGGFLLVLGLVYSLRFSPAQERKRMSKNSDMSQKKMTMGVIIGNRGFFPDQLAKSGREEMIQALAKAGMDSIVLGPEDSKHGAVETHEEAKRCAGLFRKHSDKIDGVIVTLPNFGDERAIADTLRLARLGVPVLIQATPDDASKMTILHRRDSFCGKMSACNNLRQYGIPYS